MAAGLPPAQIVVSADDVGAGRPSPDPYLLGAERLRTAPQRCAVFEDAPAGIAAARAAGVGTIIGAGASAHIPEVSMSVADLRGTRFDGHQLTIRTDHVLDRRADSRPRAPLNRSTQDLPPAAPVTDERCPYRRPEPPPSEKERDMMARLAAQWAPFGGPRQTRFRRVRDLAGRIHRPLSRARDPHPARACLPAKRQLGRSVKREPTSLLTQPSGDGASVPKTVVAATERSLDN
jgi:hypothetical protein